MNPDRIEPAAWLIDRIAQMGHKTKKEQEAIRYMVRERLKARMLATTEAPSGSHLDDDLISAFFEARLDDDESAPVIAHLVTCASCRRTTAQLATFDSDVGDAALPATGDESPSSLRQWFEDFKAGLGSSAEEVFAYQNPPEGSEQNETPPGDVAEVQDQSASEDEKAD